MPSWGGGDVNAFNVDAASKTWPYRRRTLDSWYQQLLDPIGYADIKERERTGTDSATELRNAISARLQGPTKEWWNTLSISEQNSILNQYWDDVDGDLSNLWGLLGDVQQFDLDRIIHDLQEFHNIEESPLYSDFVNLDQIRADAEAAINAENEELLASLNADLESTGNAYLDSRNALLTQQHQNSAQTMDTLASEMSRARRNAIEAGASAGVRIAENVNTLLSAQNQISNQSLETSNQLAQMLVSQRNAEAGLRGQWRDTKASTYDRVQDRTNSEVSWGQAKYDAAQQDWKSKYDANVSEGNALAGSMLKYKNKNRSAYSNSGSQSNY